MRTAQDRPVAVPYAIWQERARLHRKRVQPWIAPYLDQKSRQAKHPVYDFLFQCNRPIPSSPIRLVSPSADADLPWFDRADLVDRWL